MFNQKKNKIMDLVCNLISKSVLVVVYPVTYVISFVYHFCKTIL